ncbi:MAG: type II toxin-antitoxin system ParD family antitoxin [Pararhizobium sp.]
MPRSSSRCWLSPVSRWRSGCLQIRPIRSGSGLAGRKTASTSAIFILNRISGVEEWQPPALSLGQHWEGFIRKQVESGLYASASEAIRDALRRTPHFLYDHERDCRNRRRTAQADGYRRHFKKH